MRRRAQEFVVREPVLCVLVVVAAAGYAVYSIWQHNDFLTDYDLAIADQAVWHYSHFQAPIITTIPPPVNMLGDHFQPILILLAPLYWIWSDPRMLLIAQAVLIAASFVPVYLFARPRLGEVGAYLLCGGYGLFWGISLAVGYGFHEVAFSPLLIALCVLFGDRRDWTPFFISLAALLLVKENMAVLVVFIGLWLISGREFRMGAITALVGVAWYFLVMEALIPAFANGVPYLHWSYTEFGPSATSGVAHVLTHPDQLVSTLFDDPEKTRTLRYLFLPFLGLVLCSRLGLLCIPLVAQQLFSDNPLFWGTQFHYWLTIAPVLAMGAADGFRNLGGWLRFREHSPALVGGLVGGAILIANFSIADRFPLWGLTDSEFSLSATPEDRAVHRAIDEVPGDASVTTPVTVLPHMSERRHIYLLGFPAPPTDYVVFYPDFFGWPYPAYAQQWITDHSSLYDPIYTEGGWVVWKRRS